MDCMTAPNGVTYLTSDLLPVRHAFSTRLGGVGTGEATASLNLVPGELEDESVTRENLRLFSEAVGFPLSRLVSLRQVHSARVLRVTGEMAGQSLLYPSEETADGYVTAERGLFLAVRTADCVPILLCEPVRGVVGALHAGWRGTFAGIALAGVERMEEAGADRRLIRAVIGPSIAGPCYETGEEVYAAAADRPALRDAVFSPSPRAGHFFCDLPRANRLLLLEAGLREENIGLSGLCTHCEERLFFSHRRMRGRRGTMLSVIGMEAKG